MKIKDIYASTRPAFSFEFFPPKTERGETNLLKHAERLKVCSPSLFSLTYGAGGSTREKTVTLGHQIARSSGVETMCHVTCVGQSKEDVRGVVREIRALGMQNVMALRGDPPRGEADWRPHTDGYVHADELVEEIHKIGDFSVAVAGFPEVHPESTNREEDLRHLKEKVERGADAIMTQLFFDNERFYQFDRDLKAMGVEVPIVPGIMPIRSAGQIIRISELSNAHMPGELRSRLEAVRDDDEAARELGIDYAARQIRELLDYGVAGVHLYCLNQSATAIRIFEKLGLG